VAQVHAEHEEADDIDEGDQRVLEGEDDHIIAVIFPVHPRQLTTGAESHGLAHGELEQMINNESQNRQATKDHRLSCQRCLAAIGHRIFLRAGGTVCAGQGDGRADVQGNAGDQESPDRIQGRPHAVQEMGVVINLFWPRLVCPDEDLEITQEVANDVGDEDQAGKGDNPLSADGRLKESNNCVHLVLIKKR